jgi:hypothetical protein
VRGVWAESRGDILSVFVAALIVFAWALRPRRSVHRARRRPTTSERRRLPPSISSDRQDRTLSLDARLPSMTLATSLSAVATAHEGSLGIDRGLARHVSAPLSAVREEEEAAEQVAHLLAIKTNVAIFKDLKALIRSQPDVSRAADNVAGSSAQAPLTMLRAAPHKDESLQARHRECLEQSDFSCFGIMVSKSSATSSSAYLPSSLVAAALSPVSSKTPSPKIVSSAEATPLGAVTTAHEGSLGIKLAFARHQVSAPIKANLASSAAATTFRTSRRALATAHECSPGIEHGFAAAHHQVGAPAIAVDSLVQSETEDRVREWLKGASGFHMALKPRKVGDGKSGWREGMAKRASKLSGSHWQSATRFYTNIVEKRSSSAQLPPSE